MFSYNSQHKNGKLLTKLMKIEITDKIPLEINEIFDVQLDFKVLNFNLYCCAN